MRKINILVCAGALFIIGCGGSGDRRTGYIQSSCQEIEPDKEYHCPYIGINENDDILVSQFNALYSVKVDSMSKKENLILESPEEWIIHHSSISPDHKRLLLTMQKPSCKELSCSYGRAVIWVAYHEKNNTNKISDDQWVLLNLAPIYGRNADVHGWTSWQSNKFALFNALIRPDDEPVFGPKQEDNNAQAYQIRFDSNRDIHIEFWGDEKMHREDCLTGRLFSSNPQNQDACIDGQRVAFARRCYSEPKTYESHAWFNTKNMDGTGGKCIENEGMAQVPILRVYVVETDAQCQPKTPFNINKPIRQPKTDSIYRHMGSTPEWGEMQPVISKDGKFVAFFTRKGFDDSDPKDNCGAFRYGGDGAARMNYCELDNNLKCKETKPLVKPDDFTKTQAQPFFFEKDGQKFIIINDFDISSTVINIDKEPQEKVFLFEGIGGYPLE